jgi:hypothetical protein
MMILARAGIIMGQSFVRSHCLAWRGYENVTALNASWHSASILARATVITVPRLLVYCP